MTRTIIRIVICAIFSGAIFTLISLITGHGIPREYFEDGLFCGAIYSLFDLGIQKWRKKHQK